MLRIIDYAFTGPASVLMWLSILMSFGLIGGIPAIVLHIRKFKGLLIAFAMAAIPLLLGVIGCMWSLILMYGALPHIPEHQQETAHQTGVEIALASIWVTALFTTLLVLFALGSYKIACRLRGQKTLHKSGMMSGDNKKNAPEKVS